MSVLDGPGEGTWSVFALKVVQEREELRFKLDEAVRERDVLLEDNERLLSDLHDALDRVVAQDEKVDLLRDERRMFRRRIAECLPWVGCTPYPNTPGFSEMIACRDLAKDTLEEVPE